jgi:Zn-dependent alcohol dehydrogenase
MEMISSGKLKLNDFPTHSYKLTDINNAISDLRGGKIGRMVIDMELQA